MFKRILVFILFALIVLVALVFLGPEKKAEAFTTEEVVLPTDAEELEAYIFERESTVNKLRDGNAARIKWFDENSKHKTPYSLVYLHGWGASHGEGDPMHEDIAKQYGMNLYLSRLAQHGIDDPESLNGISPDKLMDSALEAISIGKAIGEKVILLSTSTGGTLSLYAMSRDEDIHASILCSPNIDIADPNSKLLVKPFGLKIAKLLLGDLHSWEPPAAAAKYWTTTYRTDVLLALRQLINMTMTKETFEAVHQPVLTLAYYKNEEEQDDVVSVTAMEAMHEQLSSENKRFVKLPDVGTHILASRFFSKDLTSVRKEISIFMQETLGIEAI